MNDIKQKQREILETSRILWKETYASIVYLTNREWIRNNFKELFFYVNERLKEMNKILKRKTLDDEVKLVKLSTYRLEIKNKINEIMESINEKETI